MWNFEPLAVRLVPTHSSSFLVQCEEIFRALLLGISCQFVLTRIAEIENETEVCA